MELYGYTLKSEVRAKAKALKVKNPILLDDIVLILLHGLLSLIELVDFNSVDLNVAELRGRFF